MLFKYSGKYVNIYFNMKITCRCERVNANLEKTQVCSFHLNNHQAKRKLSIFCNNERLKHDDFPVYLGVTLD